MKVWTAEGDQPQQRGGRYSGMPRYRANLQGLFFAAARMRGGLGQSADEERISGWWSMFDLAIRLSAPIR